ncbi:MAG: hypothetical protein ABIS30_02590 [Gallionella sp.]|jgi:hypothetical protein
MNITQQLHDLGQNLWLDNLTRGLNDAVLAAVLQREGTESFTKSWNALLDCLASKSVTLKRLYRAGGKR